MFIFPIINPLFDIANDLIFTLAQMNKLKNEPKLKSETRH